ncbi:MAG: hypothetical protein LBV41_10850 [Cytophagaceae bacterium]|jgi:cell division protein FtsQ|nr:hypothetical protein [Cytophagaceae bacterium]
MKKYISILKWALILLYLNITVIIISFKNKTLICSEINVTVIDSISNRFVTSAEIRKAFLMAYPKLIGSSVREMNFDEMEVVVEKHPAIKSCQIYNNAKGIVNIEVQQYEPILRVFSGSASFYLDESGNKIPASNRFNVRTIVVNGAIPTNTDDLLKVAQFIKNNPFWDAQIEQIYIRRNNDYVLTPRVGEHLVLLGNPVDFETRMEKLLAFYKQLAPQAWNEYKVINLKYKNQIVCSRSGL